jgi:hypothetical protein
MRADIHDGAEQMLQSETVYIDPRPHQPGSTKTSCNARPDHTQLPPIAGIRLIPNDRRLVTLADPCIAANMVRCARAWPDGRARTAPKAIDSGIFRSELKRNTIHAVTEPRRLWAILENMSEVTSTARAMNLGANQKKEAAVLRRFDCCLN